ncbi:hypothetical protein OIV83_004814 [Microbotryomycetes sp. JL201]|nr:hypothetical protein OIV83_004814 [Microbotryomycetes sp. JL201]
MAPVAVGWRALEQAFTYTCLVVLTCLAIKRTPSSWSWQRWASRPLSSWLSTLILIDSAVFMYATGMLRAIKAPENCDIGIIFCFVFYAITKVLFFWYFTEQIFLVFAHPVTGSLAHAPSRIKSIWYIMSTGMMFVWFVAGMTMLMGRISYRNMQGTCYIGLRLYAGATVVALQATCNAYLLVSFLVALRSSWLQGEARKLARKAAVAVAIALVTTALNIGGLVAEHQGMNAWLCIICCGSDVLINAIALFVITSPNKTQLAPPIVAGGQDMTRVASRTVRRKLSFVSQFGTSLPSQPVVPGIGFEAPLSALTHVSTDLDDGSKSGDFRWDSADPAGGGSPYGEHNLCLFVRAEVNMFERRRTTESANIGADTTQQATWSPSPSPSPPLSDSSRPDVLTLSDSDRLKLLQSHPQLRPSDLSSSSSTQSPVNPPLVVLNPEQLEQKVKEQQERVKEPAQEDERIQLWEELANALLWTIPFDVMQALTEAMALRDYAVHAQYGQTLAWRDELNRLTNVVPTIYVLTFLISRPNPIAPPLVIQAIMTALCTAFGVSLVKVTLKDSYLNVMKRAPGLGTLWVWTVVRLDLMWALVGLGSVAGLVWYNGQTEAFKTR